MLLLLKRRPKKNPLFFVDLTIDKDGVGYGIDLQNFEQNVINLFDKGIACTKNVPQLEKMVMKKLFWSATPLLETVGENEPPVVETREFIRKATQKSIVPLIAYAREYEKYLELFNLDINAYLR